MPAGRFRRYNRKPMRKRKPKKMAKVDRKQSRQIAKLQKQMYTKVWTMTTRNNIPVGVVTTAPGFSASECYIQPLSCALAQGSEQDQRCADSTNVPLIHKRKWLWGNTVGNVTPPSGTPPEFSYFAGSRIKTTYCGIDYRLFSNESNLAQVCVAVISPVKGHADSIVAAHNMKLAFTAATTPPTAGNFVRANPGSLSFLRRDVDYSCGGFPKGTPATGVTSTLFNVKFNPQIWKVHYLRAHNLQGTSPSGSPPFVSSQAVTTNTHNSPAEQFGRIRLRMNTTLRANTVQQLSVGQDPIVDGMATSARYENVPNEEIRYLVCISNDGYGDQSITLDTTANYTHQVYKTDIVS